MFFSWPRTRLLSAVLGLVGALVATTRPLAADGPVVHEYFEPDEREDLAFGATTPSGVMAAVLETPSGVVRAPNAERTPKAADRAYGGDATPTSRDATYRIDRDTSRPEAVRYDDPFNPSIIPYKRLYAFDAVSDAFELVVSDPTLVRLEAGGAARPGDDQFYGDMVVDLRPGQAVRIPTVGPAARVLGYETYPRVEIKLWRDGADNWFVEGKEPRRIRLTLQIAIDRAVFGGELPEIEPAALPAVPRLPPAVSGAVTAVLGQLGLTRSLRPRAALEILVAHFRAFAPSDETPHAGSPAELYQELVLGQKGVCRHRAFAFVLTALGLGLPTRFVRNEAHAWVEVHDGTRWRRIDLGGAAGRFNAATPQESFEHLPPTDPFRWPSGAESTETVTHRRPRLREPVSLDASPPAAPPRPAPAASVWSLVLPPQASAMIPDRPTSTIFLAQAGSSVLRGTPLALEGRVTAGDAGCAGLRLDVSVRGALGQVTPLGSLPTRDDGTFAGSVTVRPTLEVGNYRLMLSTPGNATCGPAHWE